MRIIIHRRIGRCRGSRSRLSEEFLGSESFRRQFHGGRAAGLDARKMHRCFRQHPFHEEAAGHQLGSQIGRLAAARNLVLRHFRHPRPHEGEGDEAEQLHVVGGGGAGVVRFHHRILHQPGGGLLQMAERGAQGADIGLHGLVGAVLLGEGGNLVEEGHHRAAAVARQFAPDQIEGLDAVGALIDHGDAGIAMIYEGANGIQALDLVGRKLPRDGGRAVMSFFNEVATFAKEHGADEAMKPYVGPLSTALGHLQQATTWLMQNAMMKPDNAGAAATDYMQLFGLVTFAYMWARMAKVAQDKIAASGATPYLTTKLVTGRFFMERMLPETTVHLTRIQTGCATTMELAAEAF